MKKYRIILLLMALVILCGCAKEEKRCEDILGRAMEKLEKKESLPQGIVYIPGVPEGSERFLSPFLMESLYGTHAKEIFPLIEDYAIYLSSFAEPYEIAVFRCYSASDTDVVAGLCMERADLLRVLLHDTAFYAFSDSVHVRISGRYVIMYMVGETDLGDIFSAL